MAEFPNYARVRTPWHNHAMPKAVDKAAAVEAVKKLRKLGLMRKFADAVFAKEKSKSRQRRKS